MNYSAGLVSELWNFFFGRRRSRWRRNSNPDFFLVMVLIFIVLLIVGVIIYFTKGRMFNYLKRIKSSEGVSLVIFHVFISILFALLIPNNFLNKYEEINKLYRQYEFLIPLSMLSLLILNLVIIGGVLNLITFLITMNKKLPADTQKDF